MDNTLQKVIAANNRFSFNLLSSLTRQEMSKNIFFSPFSIAMCLALVCNGANDETRQSILKTLALPQMEPEEINQANRDLLAWFDSVEQLPSDPLDIRNGPRSTLTEMNEAYRIIKIVTDARDTQEIVAQIGEDYLHQMRQAMIVMQRADTSFHLTLANSLWVKSGIDFEPKFLDDSRDYYRAEVAALDFDDQASIIVVNDWISEATQGKIRDMVSFIPPETVVMIANAIYFKAFWHDQFREEHTQPEPFTLLSGEEVECQMMHHSWSFNYWQDDDLEAIRLPYVAPNVNSDIGMYIVLPKRRQQFASFLQRMTFSKWEAVVNNVDHQRLYGEIALPRFNAEYERDVAADLKALGMECAFNSQCADFSEMSKSAVQIRLSSVLHKAFIKVDEEGTEAGAATVVMYAGGRGGPSIPVFHMVVDHPFMYVIKDNKTGAVLFMGVTTDPAQ